MSDEDKNRGIEPQQLMVPLGVRFDYSPNPSIVKHKITFFLKGPMDMDIDLLTVESPTLTRVNCKHVAMQILSKAFAQLLHDANEYHGYAPLWEHSDIEYHDGGA